MTVSSEVNRNEFVGDGSTTEFVYRNKIFANTDLDVYLDGVLQTLTTHYTVAIDSEDNEATVTFVTAPGVSVSVVIIGDVPNTQESSYPAGGSFPSIVTENGLDRRTLVAQRLAGKISRSLQFLESDAGLPSAVLPTIASLKGNLLGFSASTGAPIAVDPATLDAPAATQSAVSWGSDYDLSYGSGVDQARALQAVLDEAAALVASFGPQTVRLLSTGGALRISSRINVPSDVTLDVSQVRVELGQYGELMMQGELVETPESNLYQLAATASAGATSITVDTTPQGGHAAFAEDVFIVMRGENDANGIAKQRYYGRITSKDASGGDAAVVLGIDPPIPSDQGTFLTTYPGSDWNPTVGGPVTDRSLITIASASLLAGNVARGDTGFSVGDGSLFAAGDVCMLQDDRHATDPGSETGGLPMRQELVRVRSVATNAITLEKAVSRDFLTSENAALFKVAPKTNAHIVAGEITQVEAVDASPESRTHATLMFFADRCSVTGVRLEEDAASYSPRGAAVRLTRCLECRVADVRRVGPKSTAEGDGNGIMNAYSADTIIEETYTERCRHGIINQGSTRAIVRNNDGANNLVNSLDDHGVYETDSHYYGNLAIGGPSLASGSTQQLGMTLGNTRWLEGSQYARVSGNVFVGFGAGSNGGIAVRQASNDVLIDGNSLIGCATGVRILRDSRAGVRVTTDAVVRDNHFRDCTTNVNADGGLDAWAVDVTYSGTTARPVSVLASNGREYSTATTKLGGSEPTHTSGTTDGWTHVGLAINGINGLRIYGNDPGAGSNSIAAGTITGLFDGTVEATDVSTDPITTGITDADTVELALTALNTGLTTASYLRSNTDAGWTSTDPVIPAREAIWVSDLEEIRVGDGVAQYSGLTPLGGGTGTLDGVSDVLTAAITTARLLTTDDAVFDEDGTTARVRRLLVNLSSPGRFNVPKTLPANSRIVLEILATSEIPTFGIEDDETGSSIAEGKVAGQTISAQPGSTAEFTVLSNAGSAPVCRAAGNFIDEARTIPAPLTVTGGIIAPTSVTIEAIPPATTITTGDGKAYFPIPPELDGYDLTAVWGVTRVAATGSGVETITIQVHNVTQAADMLSTRLTIDEDELNSSTAAAAAVIDTGNDDVAAYDMLRIDVDAIPSSTGGTGLYVGLKFAKP